MNDDFANHTVTAASLEGITRSIGATQAELRAAHLKYHLSTVAVLTPEQVATLLSQSWAHFLPAMRQPKKNR